MSHAAHIRAKLNDNAVDTYLRRWAHDTAGRLLTHTTLHGGGTFSWPSADPLYLTCGYQVGRPGGLVLPVALGAAVPDRQAVARWLADSRQVEQSVAETHRNPFFLGTWVDDTGQWWFELSDHIASVEAARLLAHQRGQHSIWNWTTRRVETIGALG